MKILPWKKVLIALAALPAIAMASKISEKPKSAPTEVQAVPRFLARPAAPPSVVEMLREMAEPDEAHCATVKVTAPIKYRGRTLVEIPDITEPELRLANQLMSAGCFGRAIDRLDAVLRKDPRNRNAQYVIARMAWIQMGSRVGEEVLMQALAEHKDFVSAKVLLAGMRFEERKFSEVSRLLDETEPKSPTDLWIYMNRLRLQVFSSPSRELWTQLLEIARSPAFPPNAREVAADVARYLPNQTEKSYEELLKAAFEIDSVVGLPCKAANYASWLGDQNRNRYADVIKLLESPRAQEGNCTGMEMNRTYLAHAYLMEAAKINHRGPNAANQHLIDRANKVVNGDYASLVEFSLSRPDAGAVYPFIKAHVPKSEAYIRTETQLCDAIHQVSVDAVVAALQAGANPNGECKGRSMVGALVFLPTTDKDEQRRAILKTLLLYAAEATDIEACRSAKTGDCSTVLLPILEERAKIRNPYVR